MARRALATGAALVALAVPGADAAVTGSGADPLVLGTCTISWTGAGGDGFWQTAANWSPARVPNSSDYACIDSGVASIVSVNGSSTIQGVDAEGAGLSIWPNRDLTLTDTAHDSLINALTVQGSVGGGSSVTLTGASTWADGGRIGGANGEPAAGTIVNTGTLSLGGVVYLGGQLVNHGTVDGSAGGYANNYLQLMSGSVLENQGTMLVPNQINIASGAPYVQNDPSGTIRADIGSGNSSVIRLPFDNAGTVEVLSGNLYLRAGNSAGHSDSGTYRVTPPASGTDTLCFWDGTRTLTADARIEGGDANGSGVSLCSSGTTSPVVSGTITVDGHMYWSGGSFSGATIAGPGTVHVAGVGYVDGDVTNQATLDGSYGGYAGNDIHLRNGAVLENEGTLLMPSELQVGSGSEIVRNGVSGTIRADIGNGNTARIRTAFDNAGTVEVLSGNLYLRAGNSAGHSDSGTYRVTPPASGTDTLCFEDGQRTLTSQAQIEGGDANGSGVSVCGSLSPVVSGTLNVTGHMYWTGGTFGDTTLTSGTLHEVGGVDLHGNFTNEATFDASGPNSIGLCNLHVLENQGTLLAPTYFGECGNGTNGTVKNDAGALLREDIGTGNTGTIYTFLTNDGTLQLPSGHLLVDGTRCSNIAEHVLTGGSYEIGSDSDAASFTFENTDLWTLASTVVVRHATSSFNDGNRPVRGVPHLATIAPSGSLSYLDGAGTSTEVALDNQGQATVGVGSTFQTGGTYTQEPAATLTTIIGGSAASGQYGRLVSTGQASLAGTFAIQRENGYVPPVGDAYHVLTYPSETGAFGTVTGTYIGGGRFFQPSYDPTAFTLTVVQGAAQPDLAVTAVHAPGAASAGEDVTVSWDVTNQGDAAATGSWTDSVYLSTDPTFSPTDPLLGRVVHTGSVGEGESYTGTLTTPMPGLRGPYYVIVIVDSRFNLQDPNRDDNVGASAAPVDVSVNELDLGASQSGQISPGQDVYFRVSPSRPGTNLLISAALASAPEASLFVRYGEIPDTANYDFASQNPHTLEQHVLIRSTQGGTYYVLLHGTGIGGPQAYTIIASETDFGINAISPTTGSLLGATTITVTGAGYEPDAQVSLVGADHVAHDATNVIFRDDGTLFATFDLRTLTAASYDLRVVSGGRTATLPSAFTVTVQPPGRFEAHVVVPAVMRANTETPITVDYQNVGGTDLPAPVLALSATHGVLRLQEQSSYAGSEVQFLAIDANGAAGVLPPGARGVAHFVFKPDDYTGDSDFSLRSGNDLAASLDWASLKDEIRPPTEPADAWDAIYENFLSQVGDSVESYQAALDADATYLSGLGEYTYDSTRLCASS